MKHLFTVIALLVLPFQFCLAQQPQGELDTDKISKEWKNIVNGFITELQKDTMNFHPKNDQVVKLVGDLKKLKFNNKNFDNLKNACSADYNLSTATYNAVADKYIAKMKAKYKKTAPPKTGETSKPSKTATAVDTMKFCKQIESLQKTIESLQKDTVELLGTIANLHKQINNKPNEKPKSEKSFFNLDFDIWMVVAVLLIVVIAMLLKALQRSLDEIEQKDDEQRKLENQNRKLQNQKPIIQKEYVEKPVEVVKTVYVERPQETKAVEYQYLCQLSGGSFYRVQSTHDEQSYYRIFNIKDGKAQYDFFGDEERAIKKWSSILDSAANYDGDTDTARHIKTETPGELQYDAANECWRIVNKAKLKLY